MRLKYMVGLAVVLVAAFVVYGSIRVAAHPPAQPIQPQQAGRGPEVVGVRYEALKALPAIAKEKAIQVATEQLGPTLSARATQIEATAVLFSDDQYFDTDATGTKHFYYQHVPAWVVTFRGVAFPLSGGPRGDNYPDTNNEVQVVINATTGEYMELYTYQ